jgi:hypothetical protein
MIKLIFDCNLDIILQSFDDGLQLIGLLLEVLLLVVAVAGHFD